MCYLRAILLTKLENFINQNFHLSEEDKFHVPAIVKEIQVEIMKGLYDDDGNGRMSEYTLYEVFDEKLAKALAQAKIQLTP